MEPFSKRDRRSRLADADTAQGSRGRARGYPRSLQQAEKAAHELVAKIVRTLALKVLTSSQGAQGAKVGDATMTYVHGGRMMGQVVVDNGCVAYASLAAAGV